MFRKLRSVTSTRSRRSDGHINSYELLIFKATDPRQWWRLHLIESQLISNVFRLEKTTEDLIIFSFHIYLITNVDKDILFLANWSGQWPFPAQVQGIMVIVSSILDSLFVFMNTTTMIPFMRVSCYYSLITEFFFSCWKNVPVAAKWLFSLQEAVRCSTNWAMKPHIGSEANFLSSYLEHRTGIAEVTGSNPVEALIFSGFFFPIA